MQNKIRKIRKKYGYTQEYVANKILVSRQSISNWERGKSIPTIENLELLAQLYSVSVSYFFDEESENKNAYSFKSLILILYLLSYVFPLTIILNFFIIKKINYKIPMNVKLILVLILMIYYSVLFNYFFFK